MMFVFIKLLFICSLLLITTQQIPETHAQTVNIRTDTVLQECDGSQMAAQVQLPADTHNIYIENFSELGQSSVVVYTRSADGSCVSLGTATADNKGFVAQKTIAEEAKDLSIILRFGDSESKMTRVKPEVVFLPQSTSACQHPAKCSVSYQSNEYRLRPKKLSFSEDGINVGLYLPVEGVGFKEVLYAVDGKIVRRSETIDAFDERLVPGGKHEVATIVVLKNGQSLVETSQINQGVDGDYLLYLISYIFRNSTTIFTILSGLVAVMLIVLMTVAAKYLQKRQLWRNTHIASNSIADSAKLKKAGPYRFYYRDKAMNAAYRYRGYVVGVAILVVLYNLISSFVIVRFKVNGISMEPTLHNKSRRFINKLPAYFARFNGRDYVPLRGDIVVVQKEENNLFDESINQSKSYMVKRVVALPGETVVLANGKLIVANEQQPDGFDVDAQYHWIPDTTGTADTELRISLQAGEIYIVGDNRANSIDSRVFGPVKSSQVVGKVIGF